MGIVKIVSVPVIGFLLLMILLGVFLRPKDQPGFNERTGRMEFVLLDGKGYDDIFGGVCTGMERRWGLDRWLCRGAFLVLTFAGGTGPALYLFFWIFVPDCSENCGTEDEYLMDGERIKAGVEKNFLCPGLGSEHG